MLFCVIVYASNTKLPLNLPAGLVSLVIGTVLAWVFRALQNIIYTVDEFEPPAGNVTFGFAPPVPQFDILWMGLQGPGWSYLPVIFPMFLVNLVQNLANIETAHGVDDTFSRWQSLLADGCVTMISACFGNPFPTGIFIGQSAFKASGIRCGYALGSALILAFLGWSRLMTAMAHYVPLAAGVGFLMWIGILVTKQAFEREDNSFDHSVAVVIGLLPPIAAWALAFVTATLDAMHDVMQNITLDDPSVTETFINATDLYHVAESLSTGGTFVYGIMSLSQGYLLSSIVLSSTAVFVLEKQFGRAAVWMLLGSLLSFFGVIHGFAIAPDSVNPLLVCAANRMVPTCHRCQLPKRIRQLGH